MLWCQKLQELIFYLIFYFREIPLSVFFTFSIYRYHYLKKHTYMEYSYSTVVYIFCNFYFLPLSQRFSCIIGPNGSGKSNVIDSMLFVFGYRAQKIRSKKLSVLIHSSDKHKDVESCTVEVHFQKIIDKVYIYLFFYIYFLTPVRCTHTTFCTIVIDVERR